MKSLRIKNVQKTRIEQNRINRIYQIDRIKFRVDIQSMFFSNWFGTVKWRKLINTLEWNKGFSQQSNGTTTTNLTFSVLKIVFFLFSFSLYFLHWISLLTISDDAFLHKIDGNMSFVVGKIESDLQCDLLFHHHNNNTTHHINKQPTELAKRMANWPTDWVSLCVLPTIENYYPSTFHDRHTNALLMIHAIGYDDKCFGVNLQCMARHRCDPINILGSLWKAICESHYARQWLHISAAKKTN